MLRKDLGELKDESQNRITKEDGCSIPRKRLWSSLDGGNRQRKHMDTVKEYFESKTDRDF